MSEHNIIFASPKYLEPFIAASDGDPLEFDKELVHCGAFKKGDLSFAVTPADLDHWQNTHKKMTDAGIKIPLPVEHTENPEANRGFVKSMRVGRNQKGQPALFGRVRFRDAESAKLALTSNCSIFVPHKYVDGHDNTYERPITHVALTDYPVVTGLESFKPIAASLVTGETMATAPAGTNPQLMALAEKFAIQVAGKDDATLQKDLETLFTQMKADNERYVALLTENEIDPASKPAATEEGTTDEPKPAVAASNGVMNKLLKENRENKILQLSQAGKITPAVANDLKSRFLSGDSLTLALSAKPGAADDFDSMFAVLSKNEPVISLRSKTGNQGNSGNVVISASNRPTDGGETPMQKAAKKRQKKNS